MLRNTLSSTTALAVLMAATSVCAQPAQAEKEFDLPAGALGAALSAFADQSGDQILYPADLVSERTTSGAQGRMTSSAALDQLLYGTGLAYRQSRPGVFVLVPATGESADPVAVTVDELVITGSLLRGAADGPSPVVIVSRDEMDRRGHGTVAETLAALPQNFGGAGNEGAISAGADRTGVNATFASGVNLRGLGSDATLVLINGRRLAGSGARSDFADVSTIPASAVARIDVLLDGASALYGADAVGGVVNIILRDDFDGAETRLRAGAAGDGAADELQIGQTLGTRWASGSAMVTYEYHRRDALEAADRRRAGDADLRWLGGTDRRQFYANPGNILVSDPIQGQIPAFAIPAGQDGESLTRDDFLPGQVNLSNQREGVQVLPHQERHAVFAAASQDLTDRIRLSGDVRYGLRSYDTVAPVPMTVLTVTSANPWFVSPTGASSHDIAYSFQDDLGNGAITGEAESLGATLGAQLTLGGDWRLEGYLAYASERGLDVTEGMLNSTALREALGSTPDNPATAFSAPRDGYFNPFADGSNSAQAVLDFIGSGWSRSDLDAQVLTANLQIDGAVMELPGGPLRLAAGMSLREERFERQVSSFTSGIAPTIGAPASGERQVGALFAEARVPLFGPDNRRPGLERLDLSLAARFEDYEDIGQTLSPKIGLVWEPATAVLIRANYGESFRAPALRELNDPGRASPSILPRGASQVLTMILYGGNPDLEPEEAETWTVGAEYRPTLVPGLRLGLNGFRIDFDNRIGQPARESLLTALSDPSLIDFVRLIDPVNDPGDRADMQAILDLPTTSLRDLFPATAYGAIVDNRYVNTASVTVEGVDLDASYAFGRGAHRFNVGTRLTYLERFDSRATPTSEPVAQLDRPNFPVSLRGRAHLNWIWGDWSAMGAVNHVASYRDLNQTRIGSWTTFDTQIRYAPARGPLADTVLAFNVRNLFDRDPPFYDAPEGVGYDAANADVMGRHLSLQLIRRW